MATIENLKPSLLELSPTDQLTLIRALRTSRRTFKPNKTKPKPKKKATKRKTKTVKASPKELIAMMTKEQKLAMLKQLQGN